MPWINGPIDVYHGTDDASARNIRAVGIDRRQFRANTDFGAGFYVTTVRHQAEQWANRQCRRMKFPHRAEILRYEISRDTIEALRHLCFVVDNADFYDFVSYCRTGASNHGPSPRTRPYDIVYGPVSLGRQKLVVAGCDQMLFSDPGAIPELRRPISSVSPPTGARFF